MIRKSISVLLLLFVFTLVSCSVGGNSNNFIDGSTDKDESGEDFDFPGNYTPSELEIDGLDDDEQWALGSEKLYFGNENNASVRFFRGENALFVFFNVKDTNLLSQGNNNGDDVNKSDSIEMYLDINNDGTLRPSDDDIQVNIGIHGRTRILRGQGGEWGTWNGLLDFEIKHDGTLNDESEDVGFNIEIMLPYEQLNMTKNDTIGFSLGHVDKVTTGNVPGEDFGWYGLTFDGAFVDPQSPQTYVKLIGHKYYNRNNLPGDPVLVNGYVKDEQDNPIANATVEIETLGIETKTDENGFYSFGNIIPIGNEKIIISKDGFRTYERIITRADLINSGGTFNLNINLISNDALINTTLIGNVKNVINSNVVDALVTYGSKNVKTDANGNFEIKVEINETEKLVITKEGYKTEEVTIDLADIEIDGETDLGTIDFKLAATKNLKFGGSREVTEFNGLLFRGLEGIYFEFTATNNNDATIELFINTKTSGAVRTSNDYRFDITKTNLSNIVNFGNGSNTDVGKSGIKVSATDKFRQVYIPYAFLGVEETEVIGISGGVSEGGDWDGFVFNDQFIAPEMPKEYVRLANDNDIYRFENNNETILVKGVVKDTDSNIINDAFINGVKVNIKGEYEIRLEPQATLELEIEASGYQTKTVTINLDGSVINKDITLSRRETTNVFGKLNILDATITYIQEGKEVVVEYTGDNFTIENISTKYDLTIRVTKEEYKSFEVTLTKETLSSNDLHELEINLVDESLEVDLKGTVKDVNGFVKGAKVEFNGLEVVTNDNGVFVFPGIVPQAGNLIITGVDGQLTKEQTITFEEAIEGFNGVVELLYVAGETGDFSGKQVADDFITQTKGFIQRGVEGIYFTFKGNRDFYSNDKFEIIELFIDTKTSGTKRDSTDYIFKLRSDGEVIGIDNFGGSNTSNETIILEKISGDELKVFIPYEFLGIANTEVFGISLGIFSEVVGDWDGWGYQGQFVAPELPTEYIRVGKDNKLNRANSNA